MAVIANRTGLLEANQEKNETYEDGGVQLGVRFVEWSENVRNLTSSSYQR